MQIKKTVSTLFLSMLIFLWSCEPKIEIKNVYGTWIKVFDKNVDDPDVKEVVSFARDGTYKVTRSNKDSVITTFDGSFELNFKINKLNMTNEGWTLKDMIVTKLTDTEMSAEVSEENEGNYVLNYRRE